MNQSFENDITLDADKNFKVLLTLSESELTLKLSNQSKTYYCSVKSVKEILKIGNPLNCEGKNNLRIFYNSCKVLFSKPSNSNQYLGYFFFKPQNIENFNINEELINLSSIGNISQQYSSFLYLKFTIYDSISDESFSFYLALCDINENQSESAQLMNSDLIEKKVQNIIDSFSHKIKILTSDNTYWKNMYLQTSNEIKEIKKELEKKTLISHNAFPFIFGILSRYEDSLSDSAGLSTELGQWNSASGGGAEHMAALLCGTHNYGNQYILFNRPPTIQFLQGASGTFLFKEQHTCSNQDAKNYQYPRALLGAFFIKNSQSSNSSFKLTHGGSSSWSSGYEGSSLYLGIPDQTDYYRNSVSSIKWTQIHTLSKSDENWTADTEVTIPAKTTVCLLFYTSPFYQNGSYTFLLLNGWKVINMKSVLQKAKLELDHEMTLKSVQCEGLTDFYKLWHN